ncbi:hypothetical protein VQL36_17010 [Chengkuizengella sp. SCS-71B]|uniref:hypothetical protein n=1 Tax=Chengkuizengella sp. SCS-71B TaxID=3115290 RepID=UPI0032C23DCD
MFEESICDCCACPMQCVLKQFIGEEVAILTEIIGPLPIQITEVKNFIVSGINTSPGNDPNPVHIPICNIVLVSPLSTTRIPNVKPIQKNTKGECVCCEDPITNVANALKGKEVFITAVAQAIIEKVGEGIVVGTLESPQLGFGSTFFSSSCKINFLIELEITNGTLPASNFMERASNFDKSICDCCVCSMQFALEQFIEEEAAIFLVPFGGGLTIQIKEVKNFIVSGINRSPGMDPNPVHIPICNIRAFAPLSTTRIPNVKPIQKNTKGECVCCEDPITNVANALKGKEVSVSKDPSIIIEKVGEGTVIGSFVSPPPALESTIIYSSCKIVEIQETTIGTLHPPSLMSGTVNFDKSICDCCDCPMQFVLEQFRGDVVSILTGTFGPLTIQITKVKNFIVSGINRSPGMDPNPVHFPICNIRAFTPLSTTRIPNVKPIQKNTKGKCVCCEDPITNVANALKGKEVLIPGSPPFIIEKVGEGIVIGIFVSPPVDPFGSTIIFSSCEINRIEVITNGMLTSSKKMKK